MLKMLSTLVLCILVECYTDREPRHSTRFKRSRLKVNCKNFEKYFSTSISTNNKNLHFQAYNYCCNSATSKNIRKNDTLVTKCVEAVQRHHLRNKKDENIPPLTVRRNVSKKQARYQKFKEKCLFGSVITPSNVNPKTRKIAYICKCQEGYRGKFCNKKMRNKRKCKNGTETIIKSRRKCVCSPGWRGKRCGKAHPIPDPTPKPFEKNPQKITTTAVTKTRYVCSLSPIESASICWSVRVEENKRQKRQVLKKVRVTCPRHKCGSTRFSKDKINVTKKPLTTTTCATQNYSDTLVQLQEEFSSASRTTEKSSKKVQMTTTNNIEILPMPQTSTTIITNTQKPSITTTSTTSTVSLKTILWDSVTVSPRTVPHYDINLQIESESSSISDAFPIDPAFIGRKNRFHLSRPGAKYPLGYCGAGKIDIRQRENGKNWVRCVCPRNREGRHCRSRLNYCSLYYTYNQKKPCDHYCTNGDSTFVCTCHSGFHLSEDQKTCSRNSNFYKKLLGGEKETRFSNSY